MVEIWMVVLPLLVAVNKVTPQPITIEDSTRLVRQVDPRGCCPCPDITKAGPDARSYDDFPPLDCPCRPRSDDAEASASILLPALRAMQPFTKQTDPKTEPKPLLQPEVGLASSVLETLRQATDEEYQDALVRDAARSAAKMIESSLASPNEAQIETPKNKIRIFLNTQGDDMDDNMPEPSHIQETRCIHTPLQGSHKIGQLRVSHPAPLIEVFDIARQPTRKIKNKSIFHKTFQDMDNGVAASDIRERVIQSNSNSNFENVDLTSNPASFNIHSNLSQTENRKELQRNINDGFHFSKKLKPKINLKLRELIDNLELKANKNNILTTTRIPPLQKLITLEKPIYNYKPLLLKDLLKLKDVEVIPRNSLKKNTATETISNPNLKLREDLNPDVDNCGGDTSNIITMTSENHIKPIDKEIYSDITDIESSPSALSAVFKSKSNEVNRNIKQNIMPDECMPYSSENSDVISFKTKPTDLEDQNSFNYSEFKLESDSNEEYMTSDNCKDPTETSVVQNLPNVENKKEGSHNNDLRTAEQVQKLESREDLFYEDSDNEAFKIELLEDLNTDIKIDNDSFMPQSYLENNDTTQHAIINNKNTLNDPVAETNNYNLQHYVDANLPQSNIKESGDECSENQKSVEINHEVSMSQMPPESNIPFNNALESLPGTSEYSGQITFKDLQGMSNNILSLSECDPLKANENTRTGLNEGLEQIYNDYDLPNTAFTESVTETNSKIIEDLLNNKPSLSASGALNEIPNINSNEKLCESPIFNRNEANQQIRNINLENNEPIAEASRIETKFYHHLNTLIGNDVDKDDDSKTFTKASPSINNIPKVDKQSNFLENLQSKLEGLFSTTEKISSEVRNTVDDNDNESSNINPAIAKFVELQNLDKLTRTPHTSLRETSPLKLPEISLKKIALPNYVNQLQESKLPNFLFPARMSTPFEDTLNPLGAFSDRLRSHTENAIQHVKETVDSTLGDNQSFRHNNPTDTIDTRGLAESMSNRHDEMKEKLEAIHLDLNDKFNSFQRSILDHFNVPADGNSELHGDRSHGSVRAKHIPVRKDVKLPDVTKFGNANPKHDFVSQLINVPKNKKNTDLNLIPTKVPMSSDAANSRATETKQIPKNPVLYSRTTAIPSFIPRQKILKTNIDSMPKIISETMSTVKPYSIPSLSKDKVTKTKPSLFKSSRTSDLLKEPHSSPSSISRLNLPVKSSNANAQKIIEKDSPMSKLIKTLPRRNQNQKLTNEISKTDQVLRKTNSLGNKSRSSIKQELLSSRTKELKKFGPEKASRNDDELIVSPTSHTDTLHMSNEEASFRLVEPMKENVPYKCKLICYKDS